MGRLDPDAALEIQVGDRIFVGRATGDGRFDVEMGHLNLSTHISLRIRLNHLILTAQDGRTFQGWLAIMEIRTLSRL